MNNPKKIRITRERELMERHTEIHREKERSSRISIQIGGKIKIATCLICI